MTEAARPSDAAAGRGCLVVFAKRPEPGRVKTRLCPPFTPEQAAALYAEMLADVLEATAAFCESLALDPVLAVDPPEACASLAALAPPGFRVVPQRGPGLAERMAHAAASQWATGASRVLLRGSDSPALDLATLRAGAEGLAEADLVLCPDLDGGYGLVALGRPAPGLFDHAMSTDRVLDDTARTGASARSLVPRARASLRHRHGRGSAAIAQPTRCGSRRTLSAHAHVSRTTRGCGPSPSVPDAARCFASRFFPRAIPPGVPLRFGNAGSSRRRDGPGADTARIEVDMKKIEARHQAVQARRREGGPAERGRPGHDGVRGEGASAARRATPSSTAAPSTWSTSCRRSSSSSPCRTTSPTRPCRPSSKPPTPAASATARSSSPRSKRRSASARASAAPTPSKAVQAARTVQAVSASTSDSDGFREALVRTPRGAHAGRMRRLSVFIGILAGLFAVPAGAELMNARVTLSLEFARTGYPSFEAESLDPLRLRCRATHVRSGRVAGAPTHAPDRREPDDRSGHPRHGSHGDQRRIASVRASTVRMRSEVQGGSFGNFQAALVGSGSAMLSPATVPVDGTLRICWLTTSCSLAITLPLASETQGGGFVARASAARSRSCRRGPLPCRCRCSPRRGPSRR